MALKTLTAQQIAAIETEYPPGTRVRLCRINSVSGLLISSKTTGTVISKMVDGKLPVEADDPSIGVILVDPERDAITAEDASAILATRLTTGYLDIRISRDPNYPGIDAEFIDDSENSDEIIRPRIVFEQEADTGKLCLHVWAKTGQEDPTVKITFNGDEPMVELQFPVTAMSK